MCACVRADARARSDRPMSDHIICYLSPVGCGLKNTVCCPCCVVCCCVAAFPGAALLDIGLPGVAMFDVSLMTRSLMTRSLVLRCLIKIKKALGKRDVSRI